jgi:hypothetical protein
VPADTMTTGGNDVAYVCDPFGGATGPAESAVCGGGFSNGRHHHAGLHHRLAVSEVALPAGEARARLGAGFVAREGQAINAKIGKSPHELSGVQAADLSQRAGGSAPLQRSITGT